MQKDNAREIIAELVLILLLSLMMISCKKSEMLADPLSTNGISIKLYKNYTSPNSSIDKYNVNLVSSIKFNELPSLNLIHIVSIYHSIEV